MIQFAQITDLHIDTGAELLRHLDARANTTAVLDEIQKRKITRLLISGDIAESEAGVGWLFDQVRSRKFDYELVLGNHDDASAFLKQGKIENGKAFSAVQLEGFLFVFVDSSRNTIDAEQLRRLETELSSCERDVLLFVHHPILDCGCSFMDKNYPLRNREAVKRVLLKSGRRVSIFCGHYHTEETVACGNLIQFITPSTLYQIRKDSAELEIESESIGFRMLSVDGDTYSTKAAYLGV